MSIYYCIRLLTIPLPEVAAEGLLRTAAASSERSARAEAAPPPAGPELRTLAGERFVCESWG